MMLPPYLDHHPEHHPYLMPYNMEYALPPHPIAAADVAHVGHDDLYSIHVANPHEMTSSAIGQMVAESSLSHAIEHPNGTSPQVALAGGAYKVKRDDTEWAGESKDFCTSLFNIGLPTLPFSGCLIDSVIRQMSCTQERIPSYYFYIL